jgi:hypothetical protein
MRTYGGADEHDTKPSFSLFWLVSMFYSSCYRLARDEFGMNHFS